jgi:ectoine hydroxylase-related dioxygenase (phytanoyl-CoA dioxygenase family)
MSELASPPFWTRPIKPDVVVDLAALPVYRREQFPAAGPAPWLDRPDADAAIDRRLAAGELTAEEADWCRKWARDGYLILEQFYAPPVLARSWTAYEAAIAEGRVTPPDEPFFKGDTRPGRLANVHFEIPEMDEMLFEPRMRRLMSLLFGAPALPFQTIVGHKSSRQLEHSDSIHMTTYPLGYLAANWIAYEDAHADAGPLVYYPGSHKLPYLMSQELGIPADPDYAGYHARYEPAVQALIREHGLTRHVFLPKAGDVLLWHANLLHGGSEVTDPHRTRKALVCHFFAEGAVCYHDLTGTLTHTQLGQSLYRWDKTGAPAGEPSLFGRLRRALRF